MRLKKVIVWGHRPRPTLGIGKWKLASHTHSHIHAGYARAFEYLGFDVSWLPNRPSVKAEDLRDALVFTEGQEDSNLPISKAAFYVTHHCNDSKYLPLGQRRLRLQNYVHDLRGGSSYNYPGNRVVKLNDVTFLDEASWALYQPWATDLLPGELIEIRNNFGRAINYVGTTNHDGIGPKFAAFKQAAGASGYVVRTFSGVSDAKAKRLVQKSALGVDIRGDWHIERGYIPCRLWKGLSYGRPMSSNSPLLQHVFGTRVAFTDDPHQLFQISVDHELREIRSARLENQAWVLKEHTFVNRAEKILEVLSNAR